MSVEEELQEHTEHAKEPFDKKVAATMAILAAFLAVISVAGQIMIAEELKEQQKASDQWSYYQAKSIRRYQSEVARDLFAGMKLSDQSSQYQKNSEKYRRTTKTFRKKRRAWSRRAICAASRRSDSTSAKYFSNFPSSWRPWQSCRSVKPCGTYPS